MIKHIKKKIRKHQGICQSGGNKGKLKRGYRYSGKKLKSGLPQIIKVNKSKKQYNRRGGDNHILYQKLRQKIINMLNMYQIDLRLAEMITIMLMRTGNPRGLLNNNDVLLINIKNVVNTPEMKMKIGGILYLDILKAIINNRNLPESCCTHYDFYNLAQRITNKLLKTTSNLRLSLLLGDKNEMLIYINRLLATIKHRQEFDKKIRERQKQQEQLQQKHRQEFDKKINERQEQLQQKETEEFIQQQEKEQLQQNIQERKEIEDLQRKDRENQKKFPFTNILKRTPLDSKPDPPLMEIASLKKRGNKNKNKNKNKKGKKGKKGKKERKQNKKWERIMSEQHEWEKRLFLAARGIKNLKHGMRTFHNWANDKVEYKKNYQPKQHEMSQKIADEYKFIPFAPNQEKHDKKEQYKNLERNPNWIYFLVVNKERWEDMGKEEKEEMKKDAKQPEMRKEKKRYDEMGITEQKKTDKKDENNKSQK